MKIDFTLKNHHKFFESLNNWAILKDKAEIELINNYSHISRGYHGLFHISFLWYCHNNLAKRKDLYDAHANIFPNESKRKWEVTTKLLAHIIKTHDVIYDATSKTNELDSAIWCLKNSHLKGKDKILVGKAIEASANHFTDYPLETEDDWLMQWFLGLDLIPLAAPWEIFYQNQLMIRAEFAHLTNEEWEKGRSAFLTKIINHVNSGKKIYQHPYLHKLFENNAIANVTKSALG